MIGICRLCDRERELKKSHIVPRAYYKRVKGKKDNQAIHVTCDGSSKPRRYNANPREHMLCLECESLINQSYEQYGIGLFIKAKKVEKFSRSLLIRDFQYEKAYLFFASILWRASESSLPEFRNVYLTERVSNLLKNAIRNGDINHNGVALDQFLKVGVWKLIDKEKALPPGTINRVMMGFNSEKSHRAEDGFVFYFMVDGCLILFHFNLPEHMNKNTRGLLKKGYKQRIPKIDFQKVSQVSNSFQYIIDVSKKIPL